MERKEDARVLKTKEKLFKSFTDLLSEKTFEDITINEICIRSDIRRATFYKHFSDKYDFLAGLVRKLRESFEKRFHAEKSPACSKPLEYYLKYLEATVNFIDKNEAIINLIFDSSLTSTLVSIVVKENYLRTKEKLDEDAKKGIRLIASTDTVAICLAGGISNAIVKWLGMGKNIPTKEFISELQALVSAVFVK